MPQVRRLEVDLSAVLLLNFLLFDFTYDFTFLLFRRLSGLGPWEVVAQGGPGGALGVLQSCQALPAEAPNEAQLLLVETMTGWEEKTGKSDDFHIFIFEFIDKYDK